MLLITPSITPILGVMQEGHAEVVNMLLENAANADECTPDGCTLLAWATEVSA